MARKKNRLTAEEIEDELNENSEPILKTLPICPKCGSDLLIHDLDRMVIYLCKKQTCTYRTKKNK